MAPAQNAGWNTKQHHGKAVQVTLLFLTLLAVFFWKSIFLGRKLVPGDIIYSDPVFAAYAPPGLSRANNSLLYDQAYQFYPWRVYTGQALRQGFLPLWNPYVYSGAPFLAADQPAVFYPLNVLTYIFSAADAALVTALARLLIAGLTTYWFLRTLGANRFGAVLGGISYAFGGFMVVFLGHPHTNVAAWLPGLFLTLEWLYRKTDFQHVALVALVTAAQLSGGHAELCLYTLTAGAMYYLFRVASGWWGRRSRPLPTAKLWKPAALQALSFGMAMILGFALASIQLLPFLEWLRQNAELDLRLATKGAQVVRVGLRHWLAGLPLMVVPNLFGNPTWPGAAQSFLPFWNFVEQTLYVGIIPLALAFAGIIPLSVLAESRKTVPDLPTPPRPRAVSPRQAMGGLNDDGAPSSLASNGDEQRQAAAVGLNEGAVAATQDRVAEVRTRYPTADGQSGETGRKWQRQVWFMGALALIALGAALRWPIFDWINQLPLFSIAAPGRLRMIYTFSVSVLAGMGATRLSGGDVESALSCRVRELLLYLAALGVAVIVFMRWALNRVLAGATVAGFSATQQVSAGGVQWAFRLTNMGMYWPILIALVAFVVLALHQRQVLDRTTMQTLVLVLVIVDLFALGMDFHSAVDQKLIFPETPALKVLQSDESLFRVVGTSIDLMPNSSMMYGLQDVRGLDFPDRRYLQLCQAIGGQDRLGYGILFTEQLQPRLLGLMNVKYVLTSSDLDEKVSSHLTLLAVDKDIRIYQNQSFLPRSFVVHRARTVGDAQEALTVLQAADLDLRNEIVLEETPPPGLETALQTASRPLSGEAATASRPPSGEAATASRPLFGEAAAQITRYDPNHVAITASTPADGLLFLSDRYDPGWKAYVDGIETEIYRADYVFRAVYLTAGRHNVDFVYAPRSFAVAVPVSLVAALSIVILLASPWLQRRQIRKMVVHDTP